MKKDDPLIIINGVVIDGTECRGDVVIPDGVTKINSKAFYGCESLHSIDIADTVELIRS